ncbi:MAG TPA: CoA ester lyase [Caldilineae bacterium]|nr:CoA ester lyase [Caldilineae bacterium]
MRPRRTVLFVPGDSERKIRKAAMLDADCVVMDLEDGIAWSRKGAARKTATEALLTMDFGRSERAVRINAVGSGLEEADLKSTIVGRPDAYVLPKVETPAQLIRLDKMLDVLERRCEYEPNSTRVLALVETALGIMNLREIAQTSRRVDALMFGAEDLIGDIGGRRTQGRWEVFYARSKIVTTAAAFGLQAIDMVFVDLNDAEGLQAECQQAAELGFRGKMAIHPDQLPVTLAAFSPTSEQVSEAKRLIEAYETYQASGSGVFTLDGKMVEASMLRTAEQVLARAQGVE